MKRRFIMHIGHPPRGPRPKEVRADRAPHWIDWLPKAVAILVVWSCAAVLLLGGD